MNNVEIAIEDFKSISLDDIKKQDAHYSWRCCSGGNTDSRLIRFIGVYLILLMIFIFSLFMLYKSETCEDSTMYLSLLTMLVGLIIPHPK